MKINKAITSTLTLSLLIVFLTGCGGAGSYVDDVAKYGDDAAKAAQKVAKQSGSKTDEAAIVLGNGTDDGLKFAKKRVKACAKKPVKDVVKRVIKTAISSNEKQISQEELLNVAKSAIQECPEVKALGKSKESIDNLLNEEAMLVVSEVKPEYEGQIVFDQHSPQP
ncbi:MAG: hypothetical protein Fur006_24130 [Coleofasciculaceae cyanobacterium]